MAVFALQEEQSIAMKAFVGEKDVFTPLLTAFHKSLVLVWSHSLPFFRILLFIPDSCKKGLLGTFCYIKESDVKDGLFSYLWKFTERIERQKDGAFKHCSILQLA